MSNFFFNASGVPVASARVESRPMRTEFEAVGRGFDALPLLASRANKLVIVNATETGYTTTEGTFSSVGNVITTGGFNLTLSVPAAVTITLPSTALTWATIAGTETLTNKTISSGCSFSGTAAGSLTSLALDAPVITGVVTGSYTLGGTPTFYGITISGTVTGTYTMGGSGAYQSPTMTTPTVSSGVMSVTNYIQFPSTQVPSADANTLDDYESNGTAHTPTLTCATPGDLAVTYTNQRCYYTKIGRLVYVWITLDVSDLSYTTASGAIKISLPFSAATSSHFIVGEGAVYQAGGSVPPYGISGGYRGSAPVIGSVGGASHLTFYYSPDSGGALQVLNITDFANHNTLSIFSSIVYWI